MTLIEEVKRAMAKVAKDESGLTLTTFTMDNMTQAAIRAVLLDIWNSPEMKNDGTFNIDAYLYRHHIDLTEKAG